MNSMFPKSPENISAFRIMAQRPNDDTQIVEMNEVTTRDIKVIWASIEDIAIRWRGSREVFYPGMPRDRKEFWGAFATLYRTTCLPLLKEFIENSNGNGKVAIDLGCGNGPAVKPLLEKGWSVVAVDNSRVALDILASRHREAIASGQLKIIEADISEFTLSEPVDLVIAVDSLPYTNPSKFQATWTKIHDTFVKEKGFFVGTLFNSSNDPQQVMYLNILKEMGAWFVPDSRMVNTLLSQKGYAIHVCKPHFVSEDEDSTIVKYIAEKRTQ